MSTEAPAHVATDARCRTCGDFRATECPDVDNYVACESKKWRKKYEEKANAEAALHVLPIEDPRVPIEEVIRRGEQVAVDEFNRANDVPEKPWHADLPDSATLIRALVERGHLIHRGTERESPFGYGGRAPRSTHTRHGLVPTAVLATCHQIDHYDLESIVLMDERGQWEPQYP